MSELSVQVNRIQVGTGSLGGDSIAPLQAKSATDALVKILQKQNISLPPEGADLKVKFHLNRVILLLNGEEISLKMDTTLRKIYRVIRFYQHTGLLEAPAQMPRKASRQVSKESNKSVQAIHDASIPGTSGKLLAGIRLADSSLSATKDALELVPDVRPNNFFIKNLGPFLGILWSFFSIREIQGGLVDANRSKAIGDSEGMRRAKARVVSAGIVGTASVSYITGEALGRYGLSAAAMGVSTAASAFFGLGTVLIMGAAYVGALRCERFYERLNQYVQNPNLNETDKLRSTLKFLKESITVTEEERLALIEGIDKEFPNFSVHDKAALLKQRIADRTEVKVKYMKRRTSTKSLKLILNEVDEALRMLDNPQKRAEGITKAVDMIQMIQQDNRIKKNLFVLGVIASVISLVSMILATIVTAGMFPLILSGVAGTIYFLVSLYSDIGVLIKKDIELKKKPQETLLLGA